MTSPLSDQSAPGRADPRDEFVDGGAVAVAGSHHVAVALVVVDGEDVGVGLFPAVVGDHRAGGVEGLGEVDERAGEVQHAGIVGDVLHAPALVERHPGHDGRVGEVAVHDLQPLAYRPLRRDAG